MNQSFNTSINTKEIINNNNNFQYFCSLKTPKYNLPKDISVINIYKTVLKESDKIFSGMPKKIDLSYLENKNRREIIIQIKNFLNRYRMNQWCFYYSVYLIDILLSKKIKLKIHEIGIGALILSVKFLEIDGHLPHLNKFQEILKTNQKMTLKRIIEIELYCLQTLEYKLRIPEPYIFINIILINGIIFNTDSKKRKLSGSIYHWPLQIYEEIIIENSDYLQYHPLLLALSCVSISRDLYKLDKWDIIFTKVFNFTFNDIEEVYQFVSQLYKECKEKENNKQKILEENLNINKELSSLNTIEKNINKEKENKKELKYSSSTFDIHQRRKLIHQDSKEYILKTPQKNDSIRNISNNSLTSYINKTKALNINIDINQLQNIMNSKKEREKQFTNSQILENKNNIIENIKKTPVISKRILGLHSYQNSNTDIIKSLKENKSYLNYNQQLKIDLSNSLKNKENNEKTLKKNENENEKNNNCYTPKPKPNLTKYPTGSNLISAIRRAKLTFLKDSKSSMNFFNSTNNSSINLNENNYKRNPNITLSNYNNNVHNKVGEYQIKGLQNGNRRNNLQSDSNITTSIINNKFKFLFSKK